VELFHLVVRQSMLFVAQAVLNRTIISDVSFIEQFVATASLADLCVHLCTVEVEWVAWGLPGRL